MQHLLTLGIIHRLTASDNTPNVRDNQPEEETLKDTSTNNTTITTTFIDQTTNKGTNTYKLQGNKNSIPGKKMLIIRMRRPAVLLTLG